jgi:hypothetical protein
MVKELQIQTYGNHLGLLAVHESFVYVIQALQHVASVFKVLS